MMILQHRLRRAVRAGLLMAPAAAEILAWIGTKALPLWARRSIEWLVKKGRWRELNCRFSRGLNFGTAGLRGRTIGDISAPPEMHDSLPLRAAVGSACLNDFNVARAAVALFQHCENWLLTTTDRFDLPKLVVAYDMRHFSRHFAELVARIWTALGGHGLIFDGPRSTPELSFAVRRLHCTAGVMITASHNPFYDNGLKAYFSDGAQMVGRHSEDLSARYDALPLATICGQLKGLSSRPISYRLLPRGIDESYGRAVEQVIIDGRPFDQANLTVAYTPVHGTGSVILPRLLRESCGLAPVLVEKQMAMDPNFSTVRSPNPENPETLSLALATAEEGGLDLVLGTDPDGDRLAVAARQADGQMVLLSGNQVAAILAYYRLLTLKRKRFLTAKNAASAVLIKSLVTAPILEKMARKFGVKVVNTPVGFKWIGEKLGDYERELVDRLRDGEGLTLDYGALDEDMRRKLLLQYSSFLVLAAEESCGYLAGDGSRDKDGQAAALMVCECAAWLKKSGKTLVQFLEEIYEKFGFFAERLHTVVCDGPGGMDGMAALMASLRERPPTVIGGKKVRQITDLLVDEVVDSDGKRLSAEDFIIYDLADSLRLAIRPSGTEPKIKVYLFALDRSGDLKKVKILAEKQLDHLLDGVEKELSSRLKVED